MIKMLICDDNRYSRNRLTEIFSGKSYQVETASRLPEIILKLSGAHYDLVILDIHIEGMSGINPVCVLHSISPDLPIIALSEDIDEGVRRETLEMPSVMDYFIYPEDTEKLIDSVDQYVSSITDRRMT